MALFVDLKDYFKKKCLSSILGTTISQIDTRLVQSEPHFRASWLLPSKIVFSLSNGQLLLQLLPIFSEASPYYDDLIEHGNLNSCEREIENWLIRWREKYEQGSQLSKAHFRLP